jgi:hypothetical protein
MESLKQEAIRIGAEVVAENSVSLDEVFLGRVGRAAARLDSEAREVPDA